ncbi:hypothetical protein QR680_017646 [Steinernema hermaphroditum]|uniref:Apple domain-containing protein n=1 Tax=Steinernema hermaphroditum TaxID=289476 RepID=A0AA39HGI4_9BILA|nr:hypothetical protein QR680_017646 [Steinernema hermaphroditum]
MASAVLARILFLAFGLLALLGRSEGSCPTTFYAKTVDFVNSSVYLYYTRRGIGSVAGCAIFCADRQYCRSAIFNFDTGECSISYDWTVNCRSETKRFNSFPAQSPGDKLALIACVEPCKEAKYDEKRTAASMDHEPKLKVRVTHLDELIKARDDPRHPTAQMSMPSAELQKLVNLTGVKTVTTNGQIVVDDGRTLTEVKVNETLGTEDPVEKTPKTTPLKEPEGAPETEPIVLKNGKIVAIGNETELSDREGKTSLERTIEKVERLLEAVASGADPKKVAAEEGFLNKLIIEGISTYNVGKPKEKVASEQSGDSGHVTVLHKGRSRACFDTAPRQMLNGAEFKMLSNVTLNECRCACAKTHIEEEKVRCKSLQYTSVGDCVLNKDDHNGKYDLVYDRISEYHFVKCSASELMEIGRKRCYKEEKATTTTPTTPSTEATSEVSEDPTTVWSTTANPPTEASTESPTTTVPSSTTEEATEAPTESAELLLSSSSEVVSSSSNSSEEISTEATPKVDETTFGGAEESTGAPFGSAENISSSESGCFEVIDGFLTKSLAGGLEHDVSLEECQCFCANSIASGRYAFQCQSAIYYHDERDCVLNLDTRKVRPELFVESGDFNVTYLGMTCSAADAAAFHVDHSRKHGCLAERHTTTKAPTTSQPPKPTTGANTDNCFLELPHYVLEGNALAIETNVSVEECKCFCVDSDHRYGSECQSAQYYYDSMTCLLNKENRISHPDRFNYAHGSVMHSYFDFRCQAEQATLSVYVEQVCAETIRHDETKPPLTNSVTEEDDKSTDERSVEVPSGKPSTAPGSAVPTMEVITFLPTTASTAEVMDEIKFESTKDAPTEKPSTPQMEMLHFETSTVSESTPTTSATTSTSATTTPEASTSSSAMETVRFETTSEVTSKATEESTAAAFVTASFESTTPTTTRSASEEEDDTLTSSSEDDPTTGPTNPSSTSTTSTTTTTPAPAPKTTASKKPHIAEFEETTQQKVTKTTTAIPTTTTTAYAPVGPCRYSALYQTVFRGSRLIKRVVVSSPAQCFAACYHEGCRSANLIHFEGLLKYCELFRDSIIDYRRNDLLAFESGGVHFDSVSCDHV